MEILYPPSFLSLLYSVCLSLFRKWLTNPVRKLSQSRLDKQSLEKSMVEGNKSQKAGDKKKFFKVRFVKIYELFS